MKALVETAVARAGWDGTIKGRFDSKARIPKGMGAFPAARKGWDGTIKGTFAAGPRQTTSQDGSFSHHTRDDDRDGACDDSDSFVVSSTDPRGNVSTASFDTHGNLARTTGSFIVGNDAPVLDFAYNSQGQLTTITHAADATGRRRLDTFEYYTSGPQNGFVRIRDTDSAPDDGLHLQTSYEYDARGNVTRCLDPRGNDWLYTYNALDQCVRVRTPVNLTARCAAHYFYDANDILTLCTNEVRDATDALLGSKADSCIVDPLHRVTRFERAVDATHSLINDFVYDGNDQCVLALGGDAVSGANPNQTVAYHYDERGLLYRSVRAAGSTAQSTDQFDYTASGRLAALHGGIEASGQTHACFYDGFDRPAVSQDPMGNQTSFAFDACDNLKLTRHFGQLNDVAGSTGNVRLAETRYEYNALNRRARALDAFFNASTQAPIGDGWRTTTFAFAPCGQCSSITDDLGRTTTFGYDTAGRPVSETSPGGKTVTACFKDAAGNVSTVTQTDQPDLGGPPQVFSCTNVYDSLNRRISTSDNVGNTSTCAYDSLNRMVKTTDPRGVSTFYSHDLLGRQTQSVLDLDGNGVPSANDRSFTAYWVDADPRWPSTYTDSNGNTTSRSVDSLGRCTGVSNADGTHHTFVWNARDDLISEQDANGTVSAHTYDLNGRRTANNHTFAPGSSVATTTTFEQFAYDGLSRLVSASNNALDCTFAYDSLGNLTRGTSGGIGALTTFDSVGNRLSLAYPGGRALSYSYDLLDRCTSITESGQSLASFSYAGPGRVARIIYGNTTRAQITYDGIAGTPNAAGDFGWGDVSHVLHTAAGGSPQVVDFACLKDRAGNTTARAVTTPSSVPHTDTMSLAYDNADRLVDSMVTSNSAVVGFATYGLDRMGNRTSINRPFCAGAYTMDAFVPGPLDFQMNQYTTTPCDTRTYDENGNLTSISAGTTSALSHTYDCHDRLVAVTSNGSLLATYAYDALGRRVSKTVTSGTLGSVTTTFHYDGGSVIEERVSGATTATYVAPPCDTCPGSVLSMRRSGQDYFFHTDDQGNVLALTGAGGTVVERYRYDDYGAVTFLTSDGTPTGTAASVVGDVYCWGGMRLDAETGLQNDDGSGYLDTQSGACLKKKKPAGNGSNPSGEPANEQNDVNPSIYHGDNPWSGGGAVSNTIKGCWIGLDARGRSDIGNGNAGLFLSRSKQSEAKANMKAMFTTEKARMAGGGSGGLLYAKGIVKIKGSSGSGGSLLSWDNPAGEPANDTNDVNRDSIARPVLPPGGFCPGGGRAWPKSGY